MSKIDNLMCWLMCSCLLVFSFTLFFSFTLPIFNTPFITTTLQYPLPCQYRRGRGNMRKIISYVWNVNVYEVHYGDVTNRGYHHPLNATISHSFGVPPSPSSGDILFEWHLYKMYESSQFLILLVFRAHFVMFK